MHMVFGLVTARKFCSDQSGAVTVDWVVLSASVIGIGLAGMASVSGGVNSLGAAIGASLSGAQVAAIDFQSAAPVDPVQPAQPQPYSIQRLEGAELATWTATFAAQTDAQLLSQTTLRHTQFLNHVANQQWTQAAQRMDYYHLINQELATRGLSRPADLPTTEELFQIYNDARA